MVLAAPPSWHVGRHHPSTHSDHAVAGSRSSHSNTNVHTDSNVSANAAITQLLARTTLFSIRVKTTQLLGI